MLPLNCQFPDVPSGRGGGALGRARARRQLSQRDRGPGKLVEPDIECARAVVELEHAHIRLPEHETTSRPATDLATADPHVERPLLTYRVMPVARDRAAEVGRPRRQENRGRTQCRRVRNGQPDRGDAVADRERLIARAAAAVQNAAVVAIAAPVTATVRAVDPPLRIVSVADCGRQPRTLTARE
jgi:hypothetical protein